MADDRIRIDDLDATVLPSLLHELPAMRDGITVKLTVAQLREVMLGGADNVALALKDLSNTVGPRGKIPHLVASGGDLNNLTETGFWTVSPGAAHAPEAFNYYIVQTIPEALDGNNCIQYAWSYGTGGPSDSVKWKRGRDAGVWSSWYRVRENEAELDARYLLRSADPDAPWTSLNLAPDRQRLASASISSEVASIALNLTGGYQKYHLQLANMQPVTTGAQLNLQFDYGSGFVTTASYPYAGRTFASGGVAADFNNAGGTGMLLTGVQNSGGGGLVIDVNIAIPPAGGGIWSKIAFSGSHEKDGTGEFIHIVGGGECKANSGRPTAIRMLYSTGNIAAIGWYALNGVRL